MTDSPDRPDVLAAVPPEALAAWRAALAATADAPPAASPEAFAAVLGALPEPTTPIVRVVPAADGRSLVVVGRGATRRLSRRVGYLRLPGPRVRAIDVVHGGILGVRDDDDGHRVAAALADELAVRGAHLVEINQIDPDHPAARVLGARSDARSDRTVPHWSLALDPAGLEATLGRASRKHRYNLRRTERLLAEAHGGDVAVVDVREPTDLPHFVAAMRSVLAAGFQHRLSSSRAALEALLAHEAAQGTFRGALLMVQGAPAAFQAGVRRGTTHHLLATAFDPALATCSPGQVLHLGVLATLHAEGVRRLDFGFGDAPYKRLFGATAHPETTLRLFAPGARGRAARAWHDAGAALEATARGAADRAGAESGLRRAWRRRLAAGPA